MSFWVKSMLSRLSLHHGNYIYYLGLLVRRHSQWGINTKLTFYLKCSLYTALASSSDKNRIVPFGSVYKLASWTSQNCMYQWQFSCGLILIRGLILILISTDAALQFGAVFLPALCKLNCQASRVQLHFSRLIWSYPLALKSRNCTDTWRTQIVQCCLVGLLGNLRPVKNSETGVIACSRQY